MKTYHNYDAALADLKSISAASPFPHYAIERNITNTAFRIKPLLSVYPAYVSAIAINGVIYVPD